MERMETLQDTIALWNKQEREITLAKWQSMTPQDCDQVLIQFIRQYANDRYEQGWDYVVAVSYTHLTLPTNREV